MTEAKAVKMQLEQHKKALNDMFKALRKEGTQCNKIEFIHKSSCVLIMVQFHPGLSYRKGLISKDTYNCKTVFNIPVGHSLSDVYVNIPMNHEI